MKLWAVHIISEGGDHYYETFRCETQPTKEMIINWWKNESLYSEDAENLRLQEIWEIDPISAHYLRSTK